MRTFWELVNIAGFVACAVVGVVTAIDGQWERALTFAALALLVRRAI